MESENETLELQREELQGKLQDELARQSGLFYIVVNCGHEGIEDILWVGPAIEEARSTVLRAREIYGDGICVMYPREVSFPDPDNEGIEKRVYEIGCVCQDLVVPIKESWHY